MVIMYIDDAAQYMADAGTCTFEEGMAYMDAETAFLAKEGLICKSFETIDELYSDVVVDSDDVDTFIAAMTGLQLDQVEEMSQAYYEYQVSLGIIH